MEGADLTVRNGPMQMVGAQQVRRALREPGVGMDQCCAVVERSGTERVGKDQHRPRPIGTVPVGAEPNTLLPLTGDTQV